MLDQIYQGKKKCMSCGKEYEIKEDDWFKSPKLCSLMYFSNEFGKIMMGK